MLSNIQHETKRQYGQFYTAGNPFLLAPFADWVERHALHNEHVLEPFAGANNIIMALQEVKMADTFSSFDIAPHSTSVSHRDTLRDFPQGYAFCVTNPPWLAKNSAKRRGLDFPQSPFDDLYKHSLDLCLQNCDYVAALIPATFLQSGEFRKRLETVIFLHDQQMFTDTDNPVCLALFSPHLTASIEIFNDDKRIGLLHELEKALPKKTRQLELTFNHPDGSLGFVAFDNTRAPSIRFCTGAELERYDVGFSTRMITRIHGDVGHIPTTVDMLNRRIAEFREQTGDIFLTPFKGLRKDGKYRRRMDYRLARKFIEAYV